VNPHGWSSEWEIQRQVQLAERHEGFVAKAQVDLRGISNLVRRLEQAREADAAHGFGVDPDLL